MRKAQFTLESLGISAFNGYTLDETWNGWACPYFSYDEALKITEAQNSVGGKGWYEESSDRFVFDIQGEREAFAPIEIESLKLYPIGNASWIWDEFTDSIK